MARFRTSIATLMFVALSVLFQSGTGAQQIVPVLLCAGIGGDVPAPHIPRNTPVVLEMTYACTLANPSGTVAFSSSDSLATIPSPLTYSQVDVTPAGPPGSGWLFTHALVAPFTFRSLGPQTLTASLPGNPFSPVQVPIVVDSTVGAVAVPTLSTFGLLLATFLVSATELFRWALTARSTRTLLGGASPRPSSRRLPLFVRQRRTRDRRSLNRFGSIGRLWP